MTEGKMQTETKMIESEKESSTTDIATTEYLHGPRLWATMSAITLVYFLVLLDMSILSTATPEITKDFRSLQDIGWYGAAYVLACSALQPLTGKLYSNFTTKWTFFAFFFIFEIGSLLCGISISSNMFIIARAISGVGASGLQNGGIIILAACVPMPKRPALMGIMLGGGQLGLVAGPLFGGLFTQFVTWRWCFYINLPVGALVASLLAFVRIPEVFDKPPALSVLRDIHRKLDLIGFVLFAPTAVMLLLAIQWGGNIYAWNSPTVIGLFCGAAVALLIWLVWNHQKGNAALVSFRILRNRHVWASCLFAASSAGGLFLVAYYMPIYFQGVRGESPAISGVYLLPSILSQLVASVLSGKLIGYLGYYTPWAILSAVLTSVGYRLLSTLSPYTTTGEWIGYQIISGAGRGCSLQVPIVAVQNALQPAEIPMAMGVLTFVQTLSGAAFLSAGATILTNSLSKNLREIPDIDVQAVLDAGANGIREAVRPAQLMGALMAYAVSIDHVFYLCMALALGCFIVAPWLGWVDIRKGKGIEDRD